jgi:uncharacterized protein YjiS (DUF1127 family)
MQIAEPALQAVGDIARRIAARLKHRLPARAAYVVLRELDARTLRDLGFDRSEILSVAAEFAVGRRIYPRFEAAPKGPALLARFQPNLSRGAPSCM